MSKVYIIIILTAGLSFLFNSCSREVKEKERLNVIFVAFDDLNDWEGCLSGHPQTITPNINRLAEKGVLFTNAHCAGTMCCPSRASVITGLRPTSTGCYKNNDTPLGLYKEKQTLNKHFKENGYFVAGAGKILHKFYYEKSDWHEFSGRHNRDDIIHNRKNPQKENVKTINGGSMSWGPFDSPDSLTYDGYTVDWVRERLNRKHDKPFFLACGIFRPHIPWFAPQKYFDMHPLNKVKLPLTKNNDLEDVPMPGKNIAYSITNFTEEDDLHNENGNAELEKFKSLGYWDDAIQAYLASVSYADAQFGRLLDAIENSPYSNNTVIVLWSDHGYHLGEKEHWRKATLWEEVTRVPLIIYAPGMESDKRCKEAVSLVDIYPTLIDLCGLPAVEGLDGASLVPQLKNPDSARAVPAITSITPDYHAIRDEQYRYITYENGQEELYNHVNDPEEWTNIASDPKYSEIKNKLKTYIPKEGKEPLLGKYNK